MTFSVVLGALVVIVRECEGDTNDFIALSAATRYYVKVSRAGASFVVALYSDAAMSVPVGSVELVLPVARTYRYRFGANSYNDGFAPEDGETIVANFEDTTGTADVDMTLMFA